MVVSGGTKRAIAVTLLVLAVGRLIFHDYLAPRTDAVFLGLVALAFLLYLVPWERLHSLKAAGVEVTLTHPQVEGAISKLALKRIEDERLRAGLARLGEALRAAEGARVLWIDDHPRKIVGARRLLRALGADVVQVDSSEAADDILLRDNDFDILVTDVQRGGKTHEITGGHSIHEGTNFVVRLRTSHQDPVVRAIPVVFYAAYDWPRLVEYTESARKLGSDVAISNCAADFIPKVIGLLADVRSRSIEVSKKKGTTNPRWTGAA